MHRLFHNRPLDSGEHAQEVFRKRNDVIHEGDGPTADEAKELLGVVRGLLAELQ